MEKEGFRTKIINKLSGKLRKKCWSQLIKEVIKRWSSITNGKQGYSRKVKFFNKFKKAKWISDWFKKEFKKNESLIIEDWR